MEKLLKQIEEIRQHTCIDLKEKKYKLLELHKKLSKILFKAAKDDEKEVITTILSSPYIYKEDLIDENGYNLVEYGLFSSNNELFYFLYNLNNLTDYYFKNIPELFTIVFKKENFELVEFFLKNFEKSLRKENIIECLFKAIKNKQKNIIELIINNFSNFLDSRNIQPSILYSISYNKLDDLKLMFSYPKLIKKFCDKDIENIFLLSILNENEKSIEIMLSNQYFNEALTRLDDNLVKNIVKLANDKNNLVIIQYLVKDFSNIIDTTKFITNK
ncbi:MAG: hypothetical protein PHY80_03875 [Rickettsiales bacterium]|nr:hypothetical protein [Rickettsiales bacterium]